MLSEEALCSKPKPAQSWEVVWIKKYNYYNLGASIYTELLLLFVVYALMLFDNWRANNSERFHEKRACKEIVYISRKREERYHASIFYSLHCGAVS